MSPRLPYQTLFRPRSGCVGSEARGSTPALSRSAPCHALPASRRHRRGQGKSGAVAAGSSLERQPAAIVARQQFIGGIGAAAAGLLKLDLALAGRPPIEIRLPGGPEIGRTSCWERVWQYV